MSHRIDFDIDCPNNHNQAVSFTKEEFEQKLAAGLEFHCNTCDTNWPPSSQDLAKFRKAFSQSS